MENLKIIDEGPDWVAGLDRETQTYFIIYENGDSKEYKTLSNFQKALVKLNDEK